VSSHITSRLYFIPERGDPEESGPATHHGDRCNKGAVHVNMGKDKIHSLPLNLSAQFIIERNW